GDATTSTQQNPTHVYTANNTYNVCLTATNGGGSNQHCENVVVTGLVAGNNAPVAVNDTVSLTQATSITIYHVATNDIDPDGDQLCMTDVWGSPYVTEYIGGSCDMVSIVPDSNFVGTDTAWYRICDNGQPILCDTGLIIFTVTSNPALYPTAVNDVATALQPDGTLVNVTANDITPVNPVCVTSIYGGDGAFVINGCNSIDYTPDSLFTGNDTVWYVICDNGHPTWCDTAMLVVTSNANPALLPEASFTWNFELCNGVIITNTSDNYSSASIVIHPLDGQQADSTYSITNTIHYYSSFPMNPSLNIQICLTAVNQFGSQNFCDTANFICEGINDISLSGIQLYPNPAQNNITIDMSKNDDDATRNYAAIEIFNAIGEKVKVVSGDGNKLVTISVSELPEGMYMATLLDAKGTRRTLGRFTVAR
ncbi:MAG TPA: Ig-like domain-containing protein, partial [Chitinophagales bacterium]|nr:Ig-like domain-containing protein [Chitinophagales bacterium]